MRFPSPVAVIVFVLMLGLAGPLDAKGGKGGGGGGRASKGGSSQRAQGGGGSKHEVARGQKPAKVMHSHDQVAQEKPAKDKVAKEKVAHDKPNKEKVAKEKAEKPSKDKVAKDKSAKESDANDNEPEGEDDGAEDGTDEPTPYNKKEKQLANFQRQRDKKLAQADHLRAIAERNGNANLLANADRMEAQAYEQYARKVSHLEKFGVTDPALDLDGDGFADPWTPDVDPLDDPLSDPQLEDALGTLQSLLPFGR
jgi:hypothetical protein